jgi:hypothetical protein
MPSSMSLPEVAAFLFFVVIALTVIGFLFARFLVSLREDPSGGSTGSRGKR